MKNLTLRNFSSITRDILILCEMIDPAIHTSEIEEPDVLTSTENPYQLIVWNDDVNTFDWVIETLVEVCSHTVEQAEQCAMIIHTKGKYAVKEGSYDCLKPMRNSIIERGINATIEALAKH